MKYGIAAGILALSLVVPFAPASAQSRPAGTSLGSVTLKHKVTADGKALPAGTYQIRLTDETPKPAVGQSPDAERYVEFVQGGKVVGRELATVVSDADAKTVVKGPAPAKGGSRVDLLKGNDYVRVWINRAGNNYIINMPAGA
jgi:hypothetical protein